MNDSSYRTLQEKARFIEEIPCGDTFDSVVEELKKLADAGYFFRGQSNALWQIGASARREFYGRGYRDKNYYIPFLMAALKWAKQECSCMPKCHDSTRNLYDHEIWGWLQHYQFFTPFIDFTDDFRVAIFMATCFGKRKKVPPKGFFSIYAFKKPDNKSFQEIGSLENWIKNNSEVFDLCGDNEETRFSFQTWKDVPCCLIHKDSTMNPWDQFLAMDRIASQCGLFVYLNNADISLEQYCFNQYKLATNNELNGSGPYSEIIKCINVPNTMIRIAKDYCETHGITSDYLGLSDQQIDNCLKRLRSSFVWDR